MWGDAGRYVEGSAAALALLVRVRDWVRVIGLGLGLAALALLRVVPRERPHLSARRDGQRLHLGW